MSSALTRPLDISARSTAIAPVRVAPIIGMNEARNTSTASGMASGTPRIRAPMPMPTASMNATKIWTRT